MSKMVDEKAIDAAANTQARFNRIEDRLKALEAQPVVKFKKLDPSAQIPKYETPGAAGLDLRANNKETVTLWPDGRVLVGTGLSVELPPGYEAQVRPRSGLALKHGVTVLNAPGTVDEDYRGEIKVLLYNTGETFPIHPGERIAQLVIVRVAHATVAEAVELSETERGEGGFGSTGVK
jgi:dUTP pyrophosphatase